MQTRHLKLTHYKLKPYYRGSSLRADPQTSLVQGSQGISRPRDIVPSAGPRSSLGLCPRGTCPEHQSREASRRIQNRYYIILLLLDIINRYYYYYYHHASSDYLSLPWQMKCGVLADTHSVYSTVSGKSQQKASAQILLCLSYKP